MTCDYAITFAHAITTIKHDFNVNQIMTKLTIKSRLQFEMTNCV
jgi:hypothetical protein